MILILQVPGMILQIDEYFFWKHPQYHLPGDAGFFFFNHQSARISGTLNGCFLPKTPQNGHLFVGKHPIVVGVSPTIFRVHRPQIWRYERTLFVGIL